MLLVPSQRQGLPLEPQAYLQDLPGAGVELAHQATQTAGARQTRTAERAASHQRGLVHGFHVRPARRWQELQTVQRHG